MEAEPCSNCIFIRWNLFLFQTNFQKLACMIEISGFLPVQGLSCATASQLLCFGLYDGVSGTQGFRDASVAATLGRAGRAPVLAVLPIMGD